MQNERVHPSTLLLGFRAHTRVLATLSVALVIAFLCLSGSTLPSAPLPAKLLEKAAATRETPLESARTELPQTVIRCFFLLPHLIPNNR